MPKKLMEDARFVGIWLPYAMKRAIELEAQIEGASLSSRIRTVIQNHLDAQKTRE